MASKFVMIDGFGEPSVLEREPSLEEVEGNDDCCFLQIEIVRGNEILVRKAVVIEGEGEEEENELDWELLS